MSGLVRSLSLVHHVRWPLTLLCHGSSSFLIAATISSPPSPLHPLPLLAKTSCFQAERGGPSWTRICSRSADDHKENIFRLTRKELQTKRRELHSMPIWLRMGGATIIGSCRKCLSLRYWRCRLLIT